MALRWPEPQQGRASRRRGDRGLTWFWLCGPKRLPGPVAARLSSEVRRIVKLPAVKKVLDRDALITPGYDANQLTQFLGEEIALWGPLIKEIGLRMP